jgi:hypothetical protein
VTIEAGPYSGQTKGAGDVDVRVSGDPIALALVSTGRIKLSDAMADGELSVTPNVPGFADAINIYGP